MPETVRRPVQWRNGWKSTSRCVIDRCRLRGAGAVKHADGGGGGGESLAHELRVVVAPHGIAYDHIFLLEQPGGCAASADAWIEW